MLPDKLIPEYKLIKEYAQGGQSNTFLVEKNNIKYIVKVPKNPNLSTERKFRLEREVKALELMNGKGVPKLIDFSVSDDVYIIMEYIPGKTLSEFNSSSVTLNQTINLMLGLCSIIEKAHMLGLYHRDLKPDNIIIKEGSFEPIVIDFGICWLEEDKTYKTKKGIELGNRFLRLPELSKGTNVTVSTSDVTFLVGLLFFLTIKKHPNILLNENGEMPHQREDVKNEGILDTKKIKQIFDKGFTYELALRYQTPSELISDISKIIPSMKKTNKNNNAIDKFEEIVNDDFYKRKRQNIDTILEFHRGFLKKYKEKIHKSLVNGGHGPNYFDKSKSVDTKMFVLQRGTSDPQVRFYLISKFNENFDSLEVSYGTENFNGETKHTIKEITKMEETYLELGEVIAEHTMNELLPKIN